MAADAALKHAGAVEQLNRLSEALGVEVRPATGRPDGDYVEVPMSLVEGLLGECLNPEEEKRLRAKVAGVEDPAEWLIHQVLIERAHIAGLNRQLAWAMESRGAMEARLRKATGNRNGPLT